MVSHVSDFFDKTDNYLHKDFVVLSKMKFVRQILPELKGRSILDVGCGDGRISLQFQQENEITLVDQSEQMLRLAKILISRPENVRLVVSDFDGFAEKKKFQVVFCIGLLAHLQDWKAAIHHIVNLLEPNGICVIQISDAERWLTRKLTAPRGNRKHFLNTITLDELVRECDHEGLSLECKCRYGFMLPGMGRLPNRFLYRYTLLTSQCFLFANLNTEVIALFRRN